MLAASIVVLIIAQPPDSPVGAAFERAARGVLGDDASIRIVASAVDPSDDESVALARGADAVVELSWSDADARARVHVYLAHEARWVDREIYFGAASDGSTREARERGRLLGFATAGMLAEVEPPPAVTSAEAPRVGAAPPPAAGSSRRDEPTSAAPARAPSPPTRSLEFAGVMSSGISGTAAGIGAMAGARLLLGQRLYARAFVTGRAGSIPVAQAATRSVLFGGGIAYSALAASDSWGLGARLDGFASYFEATHLSEDDIVPDRQSRWLPGLDLVAEVGFQFAGSATLFGGLGVEAALGKTDIYTHGQRVAVVPALRGIGEIGFRAGF